jgi:heme-degrading monooxygenase HmoA
MIARMWHGKVPAEKAEAYHQYIVQTGLNDIAATEGNQGFFLMKKEEDGVMHFYTLSLWKDLQAIKKFAGADYEKARYYPGDRDFLLEFEPFVTHMEILEKPGCI